MWLTNFWEEKRTDVMRDVLHAREDFSQQQHSFWCPLFSTGHEGGREDTMFLIFTPHVLLRGWLNSWKKIKGNTGSTQDNTTFRQKHILRHNNNNNNIPLPSLNNHRQQMTLSFSSSSLIILLFTCLCLAVHLTLPSCSSFPFCLFDFHTKSSHAMSAFSVYIFSWKRRR